MAVATTIYALEQDLRQGGGALAVREILWVLLLFPKRCFMLHAACPKTGNGS